MTPEIRTAIDELCSTKEAAVYLLNTYIEIHNVDLVDDLKKLNSSYDAIRVNVSRFIELGVIEETYPHPPK